MKKIILTFIVYSLLMDIDNYIRNNLISLRVTPNASKTELKEENGKLKLHLQAVP